MVSKIQATLNVFMNGFLVGYLHKLKTGGLSFVYSGMWLERVAARPISLSLPLQTQAYLGDKVYNFFDNLLPDNDHIRRRIQALFNIKTNQPFDLLANIGHDCVGAIQLCSSDEAAEAADVKRIQAQPLTEQQIATLLKSYQQAPLGMGMADQDFRISIAGAQEKTALLLHEQHWCKPLGTTPTSHIFKLPIGFIQHQQIDLRDSCENEWLCCKIIEAFGLQVASTEICHFEDVKVLVVKRFDRRMSNDGAWLMRLPQEDMCQALGYSPALKYEADGGPKIKDIMTLLLGSELAALDRQQFYRCQILFWLLAALDGHAKNFSIFIQPQGRFHLTPIYDVISAYPLLASGQLQKQKIKMAMALKSKNNHYKWYNIQRHHFIETANAINFSQTTAEHILNEVLEQVDGVIKQVSSQLNHTFPSTIAEPIFTGMRNFRDFMIRSSNR